ncbi:MAG: hypothetical protein KGQ66_03075 [Acidobacteriota bacterium]|nr:hypothetical protein [Acidobacteriota bacterium]
MTPRHVGGRGPLRAGLAGLVIATVTAGCGTGGSGVGLVLQHRGRLADVALTASAPTVPGPAFRLGGTAGSGNASVGMEADGLRVAVGPHQPGTWRGYFAATSATYPANSVIHVRMGRPSSAVPSRSQSGIALLAVQTGASALLDYVFVASVETGGESSWLIGHATGNTSYATTKVLSDLPVTAATEDVTVRTDGRSQYAVYFGDRMVYQSAALALDVAPPFRVFLEVQALGIGYQALFRDLWIAAGTSVEVDGLQPGDHVTLTPDGHPAVGSTADAQGRARLRLPVDEAVGTGSLTIDGPHLQHRFTGVAFAGGDVYSVRT